MILFAAISLLGGWPVVSLSVVFSGRVIAGSMRYVLQMLELISVSFVTASIIGLAALWPPARLAVFGIAAVLRSLPLFWFAIMVQLAIALGMFQGLHEAGFASSGTFSLLDHLTHLIAPAAVLTSFVLPIVVDYFRDLIASAPSHVGARSIIRGLAVQLANHLPDVFSAAVITQVVFVWPSVGRYVEIGRWDPRFPSVLVGSLLFTTFLVFLIRSLVKALALRNQTESVERA